MENSKIEWTNHTQNLWWGCTKVHAGCDNCYAEQLSDVRYKNDLWGDGKSRKKIKSWISNLNKFEKNAAKFGLKEKVFIGSMMDIFEKSKPMIDHNGNLLVEKTGDLRDILFAKIENGDYDNLIFLFLTKRPSNINKMIPKNWKTNPPNNVWFGCSPVDQKTYNNFAVHMSKVNGNKFYSIEPQLDVIQIGMNEGNVEWIIQGGESGSKKRPFDLAWAATLMIQCSNLEIPYFFKQIDKVQEIPENFLIREFPKQFNNEV